MTRARSGMPSWIRPRATRTSRSTPCATVMSPLVEFGSSVTIKRQDGRNQTFRIVGTDEADPRAEHCPTSRRWRKRCWGRSKGDVVRVGEADVEITQIE